MRKAKFFVFIAAIIIGLMFAQVFGYAFSFNLPRLNVLSGAEGSGKTRVEKRDVSGFSNVSVGSAVTFEIVAQRDFSVEVEADDNLLPSVKTEVRGDTLRVYTEGRFSTRSPIRVRIAMPQIGFLETSGASKGSLTNVKNDSLILEVSGASKLTVEGEARELRIDLSGASRLEAENLETVTAAVEASGASSAVVFASGEIRAQASGASSVRYSGEPANVKSNTSGASSVKRR